MDLDVYEESSSSSSSSSSCRGVQIGPRSRGPTNQISLAIRFSILIQGTRCSGKFVALENYSHTQQYGLWLRLRIGLNLGLGLALVTL